MFVVVPKRGDLVTSKSGQVLAVSQVSHATVDVPRGGYNGSYEAPLLLVELHHPELVASERRQSTTSIDQAVEKALEAIEGISWWTSAMRSDEARARARSILVALYLDARAV